MFVFAGNEYPSIESVFVVVQYYVVGRARKLWFDLLHSCSVVAHPLGTLKATARVGNVK